MCHKMFSHKKEEINYSIKKMIAYLMNYVVKVDKEATISNYLTKFLHIILTVWNLNIHEATKFWNKSIKMQGAVKHKLQPSN